MKGSYRIAPKAHQHKKDIPAANTIFNACRQISISLGIAVSTALLELGYRFTQLNLESYLIEKRNIFKTFGFGFFAITAIAILGILITQSLTKKESSINLT